MPTEAFYFKDRLTQMQTRIGDTAALIAGMGVSGTPVPDNAVINKNWVGMFTKTTAASGDNRAVYWKHSFAGATGGEVLRPVANVETTGVAAGGTVNGVHTTLNIATSSGVSGAGNAIRATLGAAAATRTLGGTCAALQLDSDIGANNTVPASWSFMRFTNSGSVALANLMDIPAPSNGTVFAAHTTQTITHSIKIIANGTAYYIMCTNSATNRS